MTLGQVMADVGRHWKFREEAPRSGLDREGCGETKGTEPGSKGREVLPGCGGGHSIHGNMRWGRTKESTLGDSSG